MKKVEDEIGRQKKILKIICCTMRAQLRLSSWLFQKREKEKVVNLVGLLLRGMGSDMEAEATLIHSCCSTPSADSRWVMSLCNRLSTRFLAQCETEFHSEGGNCSWFHWMASISRDWHSAQLCPCSHPQSSPHLPTNGGYPHNIMYLNTTLPSKLNIISYQGCNVLKRFFPNQTIKHVFFAKNRYFSVSFCDFKNRSFLVYHRFSYTCSSRNSFQPKKFQNFTALTIDVVKNPTQGLPEKNLPKHNCFFFILL